MRAKPLLSSSLQCRPMVAQITELVPIKAPHQGPPSWHGLPQNPPIMTHTAFQAMVAYPLTCSHCGSNTPPSGTVPHVLLSQHSSCEDTPQAEDLLHFISFSPSICPLWHYLPPQPDGSRNLWEKLGHVCIDSSGTPGCRCPECWRGGGAVRLKAVTS